MMAAPIMPKAFGYNFMKSHNTALDHYVTLGNSGLRVSPLALGTMTFGEDLGWGSSVKEAESILDYYLEMGGNFLDTANGYTKGHSEKIIGDHVSHNAAKRDRLVIATKFATNLYPGDPNGGGASRKTIIESCHQSLRRLRTDYIDLYWMHHWDSNTPLEETMVTLHELVKSGKVRYIGVSDTPAWVATKAQMIAKSQGWTPFIATQIEYSLAERSGEAELIPMANDLRMAVLPWAPLAAGRISGKYNRTNGGQATVGRGYLMSSRVTEKHLQIVDVLTEIAIETESTIPRVALSWLNNRAGITCPIMGARLLSQLKDNILSLPLVLSEEQTTRLDELTKSQLPFPMPFLNSNAKSLHQGGATVNGVGTRIHPYSPKNQDDHY